MKAAGGYLTVLFISLASSNAMFQDLPWVVRNLFAGELIEFYTSITETEERTLLEVFKLSGKDRRTAEELIQRFDPKLYRSYSKVFPAYYAKLDALSKETRDFYQHTVLDEIKALIRASSYQRDFFKHFAVIESRWKSLSEQSRAEMTRAFPSVSHYLDSPEFTTRAKLGADYD